ncbi:MAG: glutamine--fructose-6-phosphate transaminase (isomerizing) [bacterium]|nr:glutamine--fructose-6-phosphate transaminase (isomerizing) [bacterium]
MCGVFGYVGEERGDLSGFLLAGLTKLEYRGYDSAGIAVFLNGKVKIIKETGELINLKNLIGKRKIPGSLGIGHTRWATHGGATKGNSHPHSDCSGKIAVVHNGIIENYEKIKNNLTEKGHRFLSETDTEVFPHLVEEYLAKNKKAPFVEAVRKSFNLLQGLNAVVAIHPGYEEIVAFRKGSPLVAGIGKGENFVSSDIPALISQTKRIVIIEDGDGILLNGKEVLVIDGKSGKSKKAKATTIRMIETKADMGGYPHFLLKEIYEQPGVIMRVADNNIKDIKKAVSLIKNAFGTYFSACGTAAYSGIAATYMFSEIAGKHVNFSMGSEFTFFEDFLVEKSLLIAASQSGETMDTLEAVRAAKKHKSKVLALVNVPHSSLARIADYTVLLNAGPERAVLSTKAYVAKLATFLLFAFGLDNKYEQGVKILKRTSKKMSEMLEGGFEKKIKLLAFKLKNKEHIYVIGRGVNYATALEGALKIKEASYIHAEGFPGGELKHGVIALIQKGTACIAIVANDRARESILSNAMEVKARGAYLIGISPSNESMFDYWIQVPDVSVASPLINIVPMQLLAYHLAVMRGYNPDKPRNLAKSVTVK